MNKRFLVAGASGALLCTMFFYAGCKIESSDTVIRNVGINVAGVYTSNGSRVVSQNSGAPILSLNVVQNGDRLDMVDNNGMIFRGTIGARQGDAASFNVRGTTTAGAEGIISGTFNVSGNTSTMSGTWAEPTVFGTVNATASVVPSPEPDDPDDDDDDDNNGDGGTNDTEIVIS